MKKTPSGFVRKHRALQFAYHLIGRILYPQQAVDIGAASCRELMNNQPAVANSTNGERISIRVDMNLFGVRIS
jgi:hypothetical protein